MRDDRFHANYENDVEGSSLPEELLAVTKPIYTHPVDIQIETLKVTSLIFCCICMVLFFTFQIFLNLACCDFWTIHNSIVIKVLNICDVLYPNSTQALKIAAQSTACQILRSYLLRKGFYLYY